MRFRGALVTLLRLIIISVLLSSMAYAGLPQGPQGEVESEKEIRQALANWVLATNRGDQSAANTIWGPKVAGWFPTAREFSNEVAWEVAGLQGTRNDAYSTVEVRIEEVAVSGSIACVHDIWTETRHFKGSSITVKRRIRSSEMWRRQPEGKWKIVRWVSAPEKWELVKEKATGTNREMRMLETSPAFYDGAFEGNLMSRKS
ncbi:MAG: DUF4440 domain-containing protein [Pyrinomonadaceae bacterium]